MRVAAYTGGVMVPSARARVRQYIGPLHRLGIEVHEYPLPWEIDCRGASPYALCG